MRRGHTIVELLGALVGICVVAFAIVCVTTFRPEPSDPIMIEAVSPVLIHPVSNEFSTGYVLVEIWTETETGDVPHIVRMKRSEYIELMNQPSVVGLPQ